MAEHAKRRLTRRLGLGLGLGLALTLSLSLSSFPVAAQSYEKGRQAYINGDYAEAAQIWRVMAGKGDASSRYSLGFLFEQGQGVSRDPSKAAYWYELAARQGYALAQGNLGTLLAKGNGVPKNLVQAYAWTVLAASAYSNWESLQKEHALLNRDWIAARMSAKELAEAKAMAIQWRVGEPLRPVATK
jgi:TPR repeat protein